MKKYYRRRLISVSMLAFLILLVLVIGGVFLFSYLQMDRETDRTVQSLINPQEPVEYPMGGIRRPDGFDPMPGQMMFPSSFYDITAQKDGTVLSSEVRGFLDDTESDIQEYVRRILATGKESGRLDSFKFALQENEDGSLRIILMNITIQLQTLFSVLRNALLIGAALLALLFLILLPVSSRAASMLVANAEKQKQFITDAGHELKTPVAVIRSNLDVMELLQGKSNWSGNIRGQVDRLESLVKQLLLLAKLDEKQWSDKTEVIDFSKKLEDELAIYQETVTQKELKLETDIKPGLRVLADHEVISQMIHALLDNAMQYTPAGGNVWIKAEQEKKMLRLEISNTVDSLPQIAPERLLDRFTRGDTARSRKTGGTGIGLSTAKSVADMCNGGIAVSYLGSSMFQVAVHLPLSAS
ncbi:MAG: HAMP domain-containing histidine kinase [Clostridia bacterium]|nr:HAMP domain-containing histidine kinase [Clostridia bacterium]